LGDLERESVRLERARLSVDIRSVHDEARGEVRLAVEVSYSEHPWPSRAKGDSAGCTQVAYRLAL